MISDRPYRRGRPQDEALDELEKHAGTQFDSDCVAALSGVLADAPTDLSRLLEGALV
jgi:HD-GYP domain-containing protein (c-di-GMP phosphodiesterase class II)